MFFCHFLLALQGILGGQAILVKFSPLQSTKTAVAMLPPSEMVFLIFWTHRPHPGTKTLSSVTEGMVILIEIETISV